MAAAFDLGMMLNTAPSANMVQQIACDLLTPYHNHMFALYDGERLEDMVESIRKNGVLTPLIVQPLSGGKYEILIGHNRWNASKAAGLATVPANLDFAGLFSSLFGAVSVVPVFSGQVHFSEAAKLTYMVVSVACPFE